MGKFSRLGLAFGVTLLISGGAASWPESTSAAVPRGIYYGVTSDLGTIQLEVDGFSLVKFSITPPAQAVSNQCLSSSTVTLGDPVGGGSFDAGGGLINSVTGARTDIVFKGTIEQTGLATGTLRAQPGLLNTCAVRSVTWAAALRPGTAAPKAGASFSGVTDKNGVVTFDVTADGSAVTRASVALPQPCGPISTGSTSTYRFADGAASLSRSSGSPAIVNARVMVVVSGDQAAGAYAIAEAAPSTCAPALGTFTAKVQASGPVAGPPPAAATLVGSIPASGSAGLLVTGSAATAAGIVQELGGRGCTVASLAVLREGVWSVFVNGAPAVVNAAFPASLPGTTPFFVRCGE